MTPTRHGLAIGLILALLGKAGVADEEAAARTAKVRAAFPAPSVERGFSFAFVAVVKGIRAGTGRIAATPGEHEGRPAWKAVESLDAPIDGWERDASGWLAQDLRLLRWEIDRRGSDRRRVVMQPLPDGTGFACGYALDGGDAALLPVRGDPSATVGVVGAMLFARLTVAEPGAHAFPILDGGRVQTTVASPRPGRLEEAGVSIATRIVSVGIGGKTVDLHFGATSNAVVAFRVVEPNVLFVRADLYGSKTRIDFGRPATNAKTAAGRFVLGRVLADRKLVESSVHWPSFFEPHQEKAKAQGKRLDEAAAKKKIVELLLEAARKRRREDGPSREQFEALLEAALEKATERKDGKDTLVEIGPPFPDTIAIRTRAVGGLWYVVHFP
jgi:hypothetical protein